MTAIATSLLRRATVLVFAAALPLAADDKVQGEHDGIGNVKAGPSEKHNPHPDARWFPDAGLGLFLHWTEGSVEGLEASWPMMAGRGRTWAQDRKDLKTYHGKAMTEDELEAIAASKDYGQGTDQVTPNQYWALAARFQPTRYRPEVFLKRAADAGFRYAVFTTKHHGGFALWPSAYGDYNVKHSPLAGRDLVKEYVDACRAAGLKVGLYFSGPDWHFNRDYENFLYGYSDFAKMNPDFSLDADHVRRRSKPSPEAWAAQQRAIIAMVRGQLTELLTHYGKIDLLWFDGTPPVPNAGPTILSVEKIRALQPGIVINNRMHKDGDYITPEGSLPTSLRLRPDQWGEFCSAWGYGWGYTGGRCRPIQDITGKLARSRGAGVNFLVNLGLTADGDLNEDMLKNIDLMGDWMKRYGEAVYGTRALQAPAAASVPASQKGAARYLYLLPDKSPTDANVTLRGFTGAWNAALLGEDEALEMSGADEERIVRVPARLRKNEVQVVRLMPGTAGSGAL